MKKKQIPVPSVLALWLAAAAAAPVAGQTVTVGGVAPDFTVVNHATGANMRMSDFAGKVLVLDFYAYWCGPCQTSSPLVERDIQAYYAGRGGNAAGIPVAVLPISIDQTNRTLTDTFIRNAGLGLTADDVLGEAWRQHDTGGVPTFVIINGVAGAPGMQQWQVLYRLAGFAGAAALRQVIETVTLPATHSADTDRNFQISLFELTRVIELYNTRNGTERTGCYAVAVGTSEDGFVPEPTRTGVAVVTLARYHSGDSDRNGRVSLFELTRVIELYNTRSGTERTGRYKAQAGSEDGFAPGP